MKKKRINQILRSLGFDIAPIKPAWVYTDENGVKSINTISLDRENSTNVTFKIIEVSSISYGTVANFAFEKNIAQLTQDEMLQGIRTYFPECKKLLREDTLKELLDNLEE